MKTAAQMIEEISANQRKLLGQQDELLEFKRKVEAGELGAEDAEARKRETRAIMDEMFAQQRTYNHAYGVPQGTPPIDANGNLDQAVERQLSYRGMFGKFGENPLSYAKMVGEMSSRHPWIKNKNAHEIGLFQDLQETHDAAAILKEAIWAIHAKQPEAVKYQKWFAHPDVREHFRCRLAAGFLDPSKVNMKANEIMNPVDLSTLDFTFLSSNLLTYLELESDLDREFVNFTMPRMNFTINIQTNHAKGYLGGAAANNPPFKDQDNLVVPIAPKTMFSKLAFSLVTFNAGYNIVILPFNDQMEEDSVIPWLPKMREEAALGWLRSRNDAIINGATGTHIDSDTQAGSAVDYKRAWNGLRKVSHTNQNVNFAGPTTAADLDAMIEKMGIFAMNPADSIFVVGATQAHDIRHLTELSEYQTFGPGNTFPTGVIGVYRGRAIRVSPWIREDLNDSGVYAAASTKTVCHLVHKKRAWMGVMRAALTETQREATALVTYIVTNIREDFQFVDTQLMTAGEFNAGKDTPVVTGRSITV